MHRIGVSASRFLEVASAVVVLMVVGCAGGPHPRTLAKFRWARSAGLRVHLTRDAHTSQAMFQALLSEHRNKEIKTRGTRRTNPF